MKNTEEHSYAQEQLENRNDVRSRLVPTTFKRVTLATMLIVDGGEDYMPLNGFNSETGLRMAIKHHQQLHPLSTIGNTHQRKRRRYCIIAALLFWEA